MKKVKPLPKEELSKKSNLCNLYADKLHKTNPNLEQTKEVLGHIFNTGYAEGYEACTADIRRRKEYKEKILAEKFNTLRDEIEDRIHQNK